MSETGRRADATKVAIVVAGMHRSGTSAVTRVVSLLGVALPKTLYPSRFDNPLGYWESHPLLEAQDAFLESAGSTFRDMYAWPESVFESAQAQAFRGQLVDLLAEEYGDAQQLVLKDPRIARLMPIWMAALHEFGAAPYVILPVRNPLEVAASLADRDQLDAYAGRSLLLWLRYVLDAERHSRGYPRSVISYERLLEDWRGSVAKLSSELGIAWPRESRLAAAEIDDFLSARERHHRFEAEDLRARADVSQLVERAYGVLSAAANGAPIDTAVLDSVRAELDDAEVVFGPLLAHADVQLQAARERDTAQIEKIDTLSSELEGARDEAERLVTDLATVKRAIIRRSPTLPTRASRTKPAGHVELRSVLLLLRRGKGLRDGIAQVRAYLALRSSGVFDATYYLGRYADVAAAGIDPMLHYLLHGAAEGRRPNVLADAPGDERAQALQRYEAHVGASASHVLRAEPAPALRSAPTGWTRSGLRALSTPPVKRTDQGDFTILLARQRSGTNALRSVLETHPDVYCFGEVFNLPDADSENPALREPNFFTFLERYEAGDLRRIFPHRAELLFLDYLEYLRVLSPKPTMVLDVKLNEMQFLTDTWAHELGAPFLFPLIRRHNPKVLHLTRKNYLRYWISNQKAQRSNVYTAEHEAGDKSLTLNVHETIEILHQCKREDSLLERELATCHAVLSLDYADLFPGGTVQIEPDRLRRIAEFLGVPNAFTTDPRFKKQSSLSLPESVANHDEVARALQATEFASFLEDEPAYRRGPEAAEEAPVHVRAIGDIATRRGTPEIIESLKLARPPWALGSLSQQDAAFLFASALEHGSSRSIEIGVASGYSSAVLAAALEVRAARGEIDGDWRLHAYDALPHLYYDPERLIGDVAREILPPDLVERIDFRAPAIALDAGEEHPTDGVGFAFIDATHNHPWPALDLLALLEVLRPGAVVVLHDINLPLLHAEHPGAGAKYLFDGLDVEKATAGEDVPNIGRIVVPEDKENLRRTLVALVDAHPWQGTVDKRILGRLGLAGDAGRV